MKRCVILVLACLIAVGALCGCGAQQPDASLPKLIIGSDTYPPYIYMDNNGDITGLILLTLDALPGSCTPAE